METEKKLQTLQAIEQQIKEAYAEANRLAASAKTNARAAILKMADVGQYLLLGRDHIKDKAEWISSLGIEATMAEKAIHLSRNREQLELELWPSDVAKLGAQIVGILPPHISQLRGENDPERTTEINNHWLNHADKLQKSLKDLWNKKPIAEWRNDERETIRIALRPLVEIYNQIERIDSKTR